MQFSEALSELWVLIGELLEVLIADGHRLAHRIETTPQFWPWVSVWLGLIWVSLRWIHIARNAYERRIYEAAEARLSALVHEDATGPADADMDETLVTNEVELSGVHSRANVDSSVAA